MKPKREAFVLEYLKDFNATQAAIRAGYSKKNARQAGSELLTFPDVKAAIWEAMEGRAKKAGVTADMVLAELRRVAFTNMGALARWNASGVEFKDSSTLSEDEIATVSEVSESTNQHGGSLKIKQYDKVKALELLGRHLGMFNDKLEISDADDRPLKELSDAELMKLRGDGK